MTRLKDLLGHTIYPSCPKCGKEGAGLVAVDLIARYGEEADAVDVLDRCRCTGCGWKDVPNVTMSWMQGASVVR